jgi:hypothetical protein
MTSFNDKEKAAENKYAHDLERDFKLHARVHRALGLWAAEKMGYSKEKAEEYAKSLMLLEFGKPGEEKIVARVKSDLLAHHTGLGSHDVRGELYTLIQAEREKEGK